MSLGSLCGGMKALISLNLSPCSLTDQLVSDLYSFEDLLTTSATQFRLLKSQLVEYSDITGTRSRVKISLPHVPDILEVSYRSNFIRSPDDRPVSQHDSPQSPSKALATPRGSRSGIARRRSSVTHREPPVWLDELARVRNRPLRTTSDPFVVTAELLQSTQEGWDVLGSKISSLLSSQYEFEPLLARLGAEISLARSGRQREVSLLSSSCALRFQSLNDIVNTFPFSFAGREMDQPVPHRHRRPFKILGSPCIASGTSCGDASCDVFPLPPNPEILLVQLLEGPGLLIITFSILPLSLYYDYDA